MVDMQWIAYDDDHYDGAPDAGPQIVGYGATADQAVEAYHAEHRMMGHYEERPDWSQIQRS